MRGRRPILFSAVSLAVAVGVGTGLLWCTGRPDPPATMCGASHEPVVPPLLHGAPAERASETGHPPPEPPQSDTENGLDAGCRAYWLGLLRDAQAGSYDVAKRQPIAPCSREERARHAAQTDLVEPDDVLSQVGALGDSDSDVTQLAKMALRKHLPALMPLMCDTYFTLVCNVYGIKANLVRVICGAPDVELCAWRVAWDAVRDPDPRLRQAAVDCAAMTESAGTTAILDVGIKDSFVGVRNAAALALGARGDPRGIEEVYRIYSAGPTHIRCQVLEDLGTSANITPWLRLYELALLDERRLEFASRGGPAEVRWVAAKILIERGGSEVVRFLQSAAQETNASSHREAITVALAVLGVGGERCAEDLESILRGSDSDPYAVRSAIVGALRCADRVDLAGEIVRRLEDEEKEGCVSLAILDGCERSEELEKLYSRASMAGKWRLLMAFLQRPQKASEVREFIRREAHEAPESRTREAASYVLQQLGLE